MSFALFPSGGYTPDPLISSVFNYSGEAGVSINPGGTLTTAWDTSASSPFVALRSSGSASTPSAGKVNLLAAGYYTVDAQFYIATSIAVFTYTFALFGSGTFRAVSNNGITGTNPTAQFYSAGTSHYGTAHFDVYVSDAVSSFNVQFSSTGTGAALNSFVLRVQKMP